MQIVIDLSIGYKGRTHLRQNRKVSQGKIMYILQNGVLCELVQEQCVDDADSDEEEAAVPYHRPE